MAVLPSLTQPSPFAVMLQKSTDSLGDRLMDELLQESQEIAFAFCEVNPEADDGFDESVDMAHQVSVLIVKNLIARLKEEHGIR